MSSICDNSPQLSSNVRLRSVTVNSKTNRLLRKSIRRNTADCAILNEIFVDDGPKKVDKRSETPSNGHDENEKLPPLRTNPIPKLIETGNRFMCVKSRPSACRLSAPPHAFPQNESFVLINTDTTTGGTPLKKPQTRQEFHEIFVNVIKLGNSDRQDVKSISEDSVWQHEFMEMIWLELQARQASRTLEQQDKYLYLAQQSVPELLDQILNYRFTRKIFSTSATIAKQRCAPCYSMYCKDCQEQQTIALREVKELLTRLQAAEAVFPSSKALRKKYKKYESPEFVARVKAMCLWYNLTRLHRLKLLIVGKMFARLQENAFQWPLSDEHADSSDDGDSLEFTYDQDSIISPTDSINSFDSLYENPCSTSGFHQNIPTYSSMHNYQDIFQQIGFSSIYCGNDNPVPDNRQTSPYRKYIEHVLKSRGLGQSLSFLHRLHNKLLRKAHATLEILGVESEADYEGFHDEFQTRTTEIPLSKEHEDELRRYGVWSEEAISLNLPSYVPAFVFLSTMPLEVMHEYLRMRLESKPVTPNPLSLEQLMKELREGLILAMTHRNRYNKHMQTVFYDKDESYAELEKHAMVLETYDATVKNVLDVYLEYVEQWVLVAAPDGHRKYALDKEWMFAKLFSPMILGQHANVAKKFCQIVGHLLQNTGNQLITLSKDLDDQINESTDSDEEKKKQILPVCREIQFRLNADREKAMRLMSFVKSLCRDIEQPDFHRDHENDGHDIVCQVVKDAVTSLQKDVLSVRNKLTKIIKRVQQRCDVKCLGNMDETEKKAIISRSHEILHQGYKFGFEHHKDVSLFVTKIVSCKDASCEFNLSLGIIDFAKMWIEFVTERCGRGRVLRSQWASLGLEFLITASDPLNTRHLTDQEFEDFKSKMNKYISHVSIGKRKSFSSRSLWPRNIVHPHLFYPSLSVPTDKENILSPLRAPCTPQPARKQRSTDEVDSTQLHKTAKLRQVQVRDQVNQLDLELDRKRQNAKLIGQVKTIRSSDKIQIRNVNFRWHRGIKIGQGRFGKVYTAVNNSTGELMAMKEIAIQPGETKAIRNVAEELKIFEGITHKHLVKLYGVEIHREELLIFMELCPEGTLETLVEVSGALPESLTRRYTAQLLDAVAELHRHSVVHRDIKPANIFLLKTGNFLKLGDFGSAAKIQSHITMPGELREHVGTQAYMAPEVFTRNNTSGYGRAADIWSVGCVTIEMASGKRPWAQFDKSEQIVFKVGMGGTPEITDSLSDEGKDFLNSCLKHDPEDRWKAAELLEHHFCKVDFQLDETTL